MPEQDEGVARIMSEARTERSTDQSSNQASSSASSRRASESTTAQGKTKIEDAVVAKIADMAAREIPGVHDLTPLSTSKMLSGMASGLASRVTGSGSGQATQVVDVVVGEIEAAVDLGMSVDYGENIPQVADAVRTNIIGRVRAMTGLIVKEVNIDVTDLYFPNSENQGKTQVQ
jgi:uncharacterized alkaline shock family protein YloU